MTARGPTTGKVVVTGGGSAGHVVPAIPLMQALLERGAAVTFIGSGSGLEQGLVAHLDVGFESVTTGKLRRYLSLENLIDMFRVPLGVIQAWLILGRIRPQVVFSKGGFVAFPVVFAAWLRRIPVVAHESDLTPGLANRLCLPFVRALCVNFDETEAKAKRVVVTGTPVRKTLLEGDRGQGRNYLGLEDPNRPVVLVFGGSLGAQALNRVTREAVAELGRRCDIVHVCGSGNLDTTLAHEPGYVQKEFIDEQWGDVLAASDVVVSRAGANSLYELLTLRKPHLLVPLSAAVSRGDQIENAALFESKGLSVVMQEAELTSAALTGAVSRMLDEQEQWRDALRAFEPRDAVTLMLAELDRAVAAH